MDKKAARPIIIGITGSFATGKSTVAAMFGQFGVKVLDADKIAHRLMRQGTKPHKRIVKEFGHKVLARSGAIDRAKLASVVFCDRKPLDKLCGIIHPAVISDIRKSIHSTAKKGSKIPAIVIDAPLLIEAGMHKMLDALIVVTAGPKIQIERAGKKTGMSVAEIKRRIKNQLPLRKKAKIADYIIDNEKSMTDVKKIVKKIWKEIKSGRK
ncbi:MAG: dephospho-CoA kinase [Candidatus Omnitrophota bacterium]|nr:dephospho-CoA kinase [Candidatus Omnitrophota bacterium]